MEEPRENRPKKMIYNGYPDVIQQNSSKMCFVTCKEENLDSELQLLFPNGTLRFEALAPK